MAGLVRFSLVGLACWVLTLGAVAAQGVNGVGRFEEPEKGAFCSGTLVAPDLVLTAAHCVAKWSGETSPLAEGFGFRPGQLRASPVTSAKRVVLHPLYHRALNRLQQLRFDLALVELTEPVPEAVSGHLSYGAEAQQGEQLFIVSWRGTSTANPRQKLCPVQRGYPGLVTLGCEVWGGESGSPVLRQGDDGLEVVAVVSSRSEVNGATVAQASNVVVRLPALMQEWRRTLNDQGS